MITLRARGWMLRRSSALVAFPLAASLSVVYVSSSYVTSGIDGYWESASIRATSALLFIAPIACAASAWEVGRLRRGTIFAFPATRTTVRIAARGVAPVGFAGVAALAAAWGVTALGMTDAGGSPDYRVGLMGIAVLAGWCAVGAAVGRWLSPIAAAPAGLLVAYASLAYLSAMNPPWVRHLTGVNGSCCLDTERMAAPAIAAPAIVAAGVVAAAAVMLVRRRVLAASALATCCVTASLLVGIHLVRHLGPDPVTTRAASELTCARGTVEVCVWPEHSRLLRTTVELAGVIRAAAVVLGAPRRASEGPSQWQFAVTQGLDSAAVLESLVAGLFPQQPPATCAGGQWPSSRAVPLLEAWVEARAGLPRDALNAVHSPDLLATLDRIRRQPEPRQIAVMRALQTAALRCVRLPMRLGDP